MNKKGFTLLEFIITLAIICILITMIYGTSAEGMEIDKLMPADDATVVEVSRLLKQDSLLTVTILSYAADWNMDIVAPLMKKSKAVSRTMADRGVLDSQIIWGFANKGGLAEDPMPIPRADGVYLYLN